MPLLDPDRPAVVRTWAFRAALACGVADLLAGVGGIGYFAAQLGFDLRDFGAVVWAIVLAIFGGAGVLPGIIFIALATPVRRGGRAAWVALVSTGGLHACVTLWLLDRSASLLYSSLRYNAGDAWGLALFATVTGVLLVMDVTMLVLAFWSTQLRANRDPIGHGFEPVMGALTRRPTAGTRPSEAQSAGSGPPSRSLNG